MRDGFTYNDGGRSAAGFKANNVGDCVPRAVAIITGLPYREVYDALAAGNAGQRITKHSAKRGARGKTAQHGIWTKRKWFKDYMTSLGFRWVPTMKIGEGCKVHLDANELPAGRLVISLSKHYTAMIDGVIHDTYDPRRSKSYSFEQDHGQELKPNQGRNSNGVWTEIGGRCVYGYWVYEGGTT